MFVRFLSVLRNEAGEGGDGGGGEVGNAEPSADNALQRQEVRPRGRHAEKREAVVKTAAALKEQLAAKKTAEKAPKAAEPEPADKPEAKEPAKEREPTKEPKDATSAKAERTADKIEDEGGKAPEQKANETDKQYELRLSRALQDLRNQETVTKREKSRAEAAERERDTEKKEREKLVKLFERGKNPEDALDFLYETTGLTLEDLIKNINDGKTKPVGAKPKLPPEVQERIEAQEAELKRLAKLEDERAEQTRVQQQEARFKGHVEEATGWLKNNAEEFPLLVKVPWAAQNIVNGAYKNGGDLSEPARRLQDSMINDFAPLLEDDHAISLLSKKLSKGAKELLAKKFGVQVAAAPAGVVVQEHVRKPATTPLSRAPTDAPTPLKVDKKASKREQVRVAARLFEQSYRKQG